MTKHINPDDIKNMSAKVKFSQNDLKRHGGKKQMMRAILDARDKEETTKK